MFLLSIMTVIPGGEMTLMIFVKLIHIINVFLFTSECKYFSGALIAG